jgi:RimJ/RimL family protein N-acetyltransferase
VADDGALIGHTALFPINAQKCELLAVVAPAWQNRGIGTELVHGAVQLADELGFQRIWLPVDAINVRARHVYQKCGFEYVSQGHARELDMALDVRRVVARGRLDQAAPCVPAPLGPFGTSRAERQSGASCDT